jgi:Fe/S biogenesis protein NfuA
LTLKSGITKTIMETVPEVTEVVDVTDHATGEHPYFTSAEGATSVASSES